MFLSSSGIWFDLLCVANRRTDVIFLMHNFRNEIAHNAHNLLFCNRHNRFDYTMCKPPYSDIRCRNTPGIPHRILNLCNQHKRTLHISNSRHILGSLRRNIHCIYYNILILCNQHRTFPHTPYRNYIFGSLRKSFHHIRSSTENIHNHCSLRKKQQY